jgi:hypothetical protein
MYTGKRFLCSGKLFKNFAGVLYILTLSLKNGSESPHKNAFRRKAWHMTVLGKELSLMYITLKENIT